MSTSDVSYLNNGRGAARIFKNCQALFSKKRRKKRSPTVYCRTSNFSQFVKSLNLLALPKNEISFLLSKKKNMHFACPFHSLLVFSINCISSCSTRNEDFNDSVTTKSITTMNTASNFTSSIETFNNITLFI